MKLATLLLLTLLVCPSTFAKVDSEGVKLSALFSEFNELLSDFVVAKSLSDGGLETSFDYIKAHKDGETRKRIDKQLTKLREFNIKKLNGPKQSVAFWINAYNFFMIKVILNDGFHNNKLSIESVKDFGSFFNPYRIFREKYHKVNHNVYSLDQIEKEILLGDEYKKKGWKDARVHFAVNCASVGCPPLLNKIYLAATLDKTLSENVKKALKTPRHLHINNNTLYLTSLFKWYKKDFVEDSGSVKGFIKKYADQQTYAEIDKTSRTSFINYDWKLNLPKNFK